jgi:TldD protein
MDRINPSQYAGLFSGYTELRIQENKSLSIAFLKGNNVANIKSASSGVSARVYKNGAWGFASNSQKTDEAIRFVIDAATKNAIFLDSREKKKLNPLPIASYSSINDFSTQKPHLSQGELVAFLKEIDEYILKKYPDLSSRSISLNCLNMEKNLLTSDGSSAYSMVPLTRIAISLTIEKDGEPINLGQLYGGLGEFEDQFVTPSSLFPKIDQLYEHLMRKREGVFAEAGQKTCILAPELAGILAHEAIGHTTEADLVLSGSIASRYLDKQIASPFITLIDFAHTALGKTCPVPVYVDDEGTKAQDSVIIEKGILKSYLHNKESARHFQVEPTGNARAYRFSDEPLIRMRNTAILPGTDHLEEMIASIDDGYYLLHTNNGQADSTSEFMFGVTLGYEIKNGKLGKAIKDTTISGIAVDVLKNVDMVSQEFKWLSGGMCGKKQLIPVGLGGPAIKCQIKIGGR